MIGRFRIDDSDDNDEDDDANEWQNFGKIRHSDCTMHETRLCLMVSDDHDDEDDNYDDNDKAMEVENRNLMMIIGHWYIT